MKNLSDDCDSNLLRLGVSIHSRNLHEELHDYIIKYKPVLKSISTKKKMLPDCGRHYLEVPGIRYYLLYMDTPFPDDLRHSQPFPTFLRKLEALKKTCRNVDGVSCSGFIPDTENYPSLSSARCPAGTTKLSVMPDGSVYPCYLFFRHARFRLGNILSDDFRKIWQSPVLNYFRSFEANRCVHTACDIFSVCHGGCPAMSLLIYDDISGPDPRCVPSFRFS